MAMLIVDGIELPDPSGMTWGLQDVSADDAGRVQDDNDTMYKNRTSQKRKLSLSWNNPDPQKAALILQVFNPEYFMVTYPDVLTGTSETREFYAGDRTAPFKMWTVNKKRYSSVAFDIIER